MCFRRSRAAARHEERIGTCESTPLRVVSSARRRRRSARWPLRLGR
jgi:hypothetical protein